MNVSEYPQHTIADFTVGQVVERGFVVTSDDLGQFGRVSGDDHPLHRDRAFATERRFPGVVVHGMLLASKSSAFVAREFVGRAGLLVALTSDFRLPVLCDEPLRWRGVVMRVNAAAGTVDVDWDVRNNRNSVVVRGTACAKLPASE